MKHQCRTGSGSDLVRLVIGPTLLATETRSLPLPVLTPLRVRKLGHYPVLYQGQGTVSRSWRFIAHSLIVEPLLKEEQIYVEAILFHRSAAR